MADASFSDALNWLANRQDQRAYIEIGQADPHADNAADAPLARFHATLGRIEAPDDVMHARGVAWIPFGAEHGGDGLHLDAARFVGAKIHPSGALKIWQRGVYIGVVVAEPAAA